MAQSQEDSDMLNVLHGMRKTSSRFFGSIAWFFRYPLKNKLRLLLCIVISVVLLTVIWYVRKPFYRASMTVSHTRMDNGSCSEMITVLDQSISGDNEGLANQLHIPVEAARAVRNIEFKLQNQQLAARYQDSIHVLLPFIVEVEVLRRSVLDTIERAVINYLETNEFITRRKEMDIASLSKTEDWLNSELKELDSLKKVVNQSIIPRGTGQGIIFGEPIDPVLVYRRALELFDRRLTLQKKQAFINSFEVLIGFNRSPKRADPPLVLYILVGLIIGYIWSLFWQLSSDRRKGLQV